MRIAVRSSGGHSGPVISMLPAALIAAGCAPQAVERCDVLVYGATGGGTVAAIAAAGEGMAVVLLEPGRHVGGMVSGGLGATDFGNKGVIGGMSREFFARTGRHYGQPLAWYFEPHVAERVFRDWLAEAGVPVRFEHRLAAVEGEGNRIRRIRTRNGAVFEAAVFIDASYEGDLMARSGVTWTVGREGVDRYGESLAGRREVCEYHQFKVPVSPYGPDGKLLPGVYGGDPGRVGEGDRKVQAYNFRVCLSNRKDNQVPFPRPEGYDPWRYELLRRYLEKMPDLRLDQLIHIVMLPNGKTDVNNNGPFSTDHIGGSWEYPEADDRRRQEIWQDHVNYVQGFFYFLANDPSVPRHIRDELNTWGLAADEFQDTGHWPHQLYIREARRMIGAYVMRQADLQTDLTKDDSIGMGSYNSDSHHVQRIPTPDGAVINEGDMQVPVKPYEIPYRAIVPQPRQCGNLLVPVCVSASHVAYSSMRMEPQYMIMGQAAGVAAAMAVRHDTPVADIDIRRLQARLRAGGAVLCAAEAVSEGMDARSLPGIVVDNLAARLSGPWRASMATPGFVGLDYLHDGDAGKGGCVARFVPALPAGGLYEVRISCVPHANRSTQVPVTVNTAEGPVTIRVDQRSAPPRGSLTPLGTFRLGGGEEGWVDIRNEGTVGHVIADAVQWIPAGAGGTP